MASEHCSSTAPCQGDTKLLSQPPITSPYLFQRTGTAAQMSATRKWRIDRMGERWCAFQPWAGRVWWLRFFDSFEDARTFVEGAIASVARAR